MNNYLFRLDASSTIGMGHLSRCRTLANEIKSLGNNVLFLVGTDFPERVKSELVDFNVEVSASLELDRDIEWTKKYVENYNPSWIIVDHYGLDHRWEKAICSPTSKILVIDDLAQRKHFCHALIDQTYGRIIEDYHQLVPENVQYFLGKDYLLLSQEFVKKIPVAKKRVITDQPHKIMISMGGADSKNATSVVLKGLALVGEKLLLDVVLSSSSKHRSQVESLVKDSKHEINLLFDVKNMNELMLAADLGVGAGGISMWERMSLGLPSMIIKTADNQNLTVSEMAAINAIKYLGSIENVTPERVVNSFNECTKEWREQTSILGMQVINSSGASKIALSLNSYKVS